MAGRVQFVTRARRVSPMPEWAAEFAALLEHATESRLLEQVAQRLRFAYRRGFPMLDIVVFFLAMACGYSRGGIRGFRDGIGGCAARLAAIAGRKDLPTSASVSRALQAADRIEDLDQQVAWLLSSGAQVQALVRSPLVQVRDAVGDGWTALDFDPSVTALRQRALPEDDDLPAPRRRAARLCAPGYPGRHRGETQFSTAILSHTGAGLFVQATTHAGNTPFTDAVGTAALAAVQLVDACELPRGRTLVRFDGAGGYAAAMAQVASHGLHFLTRLKHLGVLDEPAVIEHLARATWHDVADSRSGPRRQATELGRCVVGDDGQGGAVTARLVVSRFASDGHKHGAGKVVGEFQYEVFANDLDATAWPAADTVTLYYGRCGQENQFGQAIKQMRLGDIFSYDLHGQRLATALLMWVSNLRLTRAAAAAGDLGMAPPQQQRPPTSAEPLDGRCEQDHVSAMPGPTEPAADSQPAGDQLPTHKSCPAGLLAPLHNIRAFKGHGCCAIYRMPRGTCSQCPQRAGCITSTNLASRREFSMSLAVSVLADRATILAQVRGAASPDQAGPVVSRKLKPARAVPAPTLVAPRWMSPVPAAAGPLLSAASSLRPSVLTQIWHEHMRGYAIDVRIVGQTSPPQNRPWMASTPAHRQRRRRTWAERDAFNALNARVLVSRYPLTHDTVNQHVDRKAA